MRGRSCGDPFSFIEWRQARQLAMSTHANLNFRATVGSGVGCGVWVFELLLSGTLDTLLRKLKNKWLMKSTDRTYLNPRLILEVFAAISVDLIRWNCSSDMISLPEWRIRIFSKTRILKHSINFSFGKFSIWDIPDTRISLPETDFITIFTSIYTTCR